MEQHLSVVTLGRNDLKHAPSFVEALGRRTAAVRRAASH
jgi:hypothetical protein